MVIIQKCGKAGLLAGLSAFLIELSR